MNYSVTLGLYAVERLEVCVTNVRDLRQHLTYGPISAESNVIIEQYDTQHAALCGSVV